MLIKWGFVLAALSGPGTFYEYHSAQNCEISMAEMNSIPLEQTVLQCGVYTVPQLERMRSAHQRPARWWSWLTYGSRGEWLLEFDRGTLDQCEHDTDMLASNPKFINVKVRLRCLPEPPGQPA